MSWSTIHLEVTTPLFNAGHDAEGDASTGVRVPSILGAMRFWFRAMAGAHLGPDLSALRSWEGRVFGRAASEAGGGRDDAASPIQWRITEQPTVHPVGQRPPWLPSWGKKAPTVHTGEIAIRQSFDRWIVYLLGQGLGDMAECTLRRPFVPPGQPIRLRFRIRRDDPAAVSLALASLWLTCTFGGVGARTRRGFGGLRITNVELADDVTLPEPWSDPSQLLTPGWDFYQQVSTSQCLLPWVLRECSALRLRSHKSDSPRPLQAWAGRPTFPVLGERVTIAGLGPEFESWSDTLSDSGLLWRQFRASTDAPGVGYLPEAKTPEWTTSVTARGSHFPLGALGLPIEFKKRDWKVEVRSPDSTEPLRRASPVWLRPVGSGKQWALLTFAFLSDFLPDDHTVQVMRGERRVDHEVQVHDTDLDDLARLWVQGIVSGGDIILPGYRPNP